MMSMDVSTRTTSTWPIQMAGREHWRLRRSPDRDSDNWRVFSLSDFKWPNPGRWAWSVSVRQPQDLPRLRNVYGRLIELCESQGVAQPGELPWNVRMNDPDVQWCLAREVSLFGHPDLAMRDVRRPVYLLPGHDGGILDEELEGLDAAVAELLGEPSVVKRVRKVRDAEEDERHLFIAIGSGGMTFPVLSALMGRPTRLPETSELVLPDGLTHLWLAPRYTHVLIGWTAEQNWQIYEVYNGDGGT